LAVRIRLRRMGTTKRACYRIVVADSRSPRDGRFIENLGQYDPRPNPSLIEIDEDKALDWLKKGAQPSEPVKQLLKIKGVWQRYEEGPQSPSEEAAQ
jgi:small subunit ribosomal protein S16